MGNEGEKMRNTRKGLALGMGKGYKNVLSIYDPHVHSMSARGIKTYTTLNMYGIDEINRMNTEAGRKAKGKQPYVVSDASSVNSEDIRQIPNFGNYRPKGWKLGEVYFVDSSGMGQEGEGALTFGQFLSQLKSGKGYAIIEAGQFQVRIGEFSKASSLDAKGIAIRPNMYDIVNKAQRDKELKITEAGKKTKGEWAFDLTDFRSKEDWKTFLAKNKFELVGKMKTDEKDKFSHFEYKNPDGFKILTEHNPLEGEDAFLGYVGMTYPKNKETQFKKVVKDFKQGAIDIKEENPHEQTYISDAWLYMNAKGKKDWVDRLYGHKTSKRTKNITKGVVYTAGALALLGASSRVLRAKGKFFTQKQFYESYVKPNLTENDKPLNRQIFNDQLDYVEKEGLVNKKLSKNWVYPSTKKFE